MNEWVDVAPADEFEPGTFRVLELDDTPVAVFNVDGRFYAIENVCTHDYEILSGGPIEGEEIVCPRHGARFDLKTGEALSPPAYEPVATYSVRVDNGMVQVRNS